MYVVQMSEQMTVVMNSEKKVKSSEAFYKVRYSTYCSNYLDICDKASPREINKHGFICFCFYYWL